MLWLQVEDGVSFLVPVLDIQVKFDWTPVFKSGRGRREGGVGNQLCPLKPVKAELSGGGGDEALPAHAAA